MEAGAAICALKGGNASVMTLSGCTLKRVCLPPAPCHTMALRACLSHPLGLPSCPRPSFCTPFLIPRMLPTKKFGGIRIIQSHTFSSTLSWLNLLTV